MQVSQEIEASETLDILSAADLFKTDMDDNGFMPGDDDYVKPEVEEIEQEEESEEDPVSEEDEVDEEAESEEEAEVDSAKAEPEDKLFEVEIGDDVYEVNEEELKAGYLRNEQFIGRSSQLETEYTAKVNTLTEKEVQIDSELDALIMLQQQDLAQYRNVNWNELKVVDPDQYKALRAEFHDVQEKASLFQARKNELNQLRGQAEKIKHQAYLKAQQELAVKLVPEFADPVFQKELIEFGKGIGYSEGELRNIADARHLMLLNQARLYDRSQLKRKEALEKKVPKEVPKVTKPGVSKAVGKVDAKAVGRTAATLKSTGSINAARDYFLTAGLI